MGPQTYCAGFGRRPSLTRMLTYLQYAPLLASGRTCPKPCSRRSGRSSRESLFDATCTSFFGSPRLIFCFAIFVLFLLPFPLLAQTTVKLPLPVESPLNALTFDVAAPTGGVLTGFLLPSSGPLTAWAPVWSTLQADGSLKEAQSAGWSGVRPDRWLKVVKEGHVVGGLKVLVRTGPGAVQTRQVQVLWRPWKDGAPEGELVTSRAYGQAATDADAVRIIELTLPKGGVPTGFYGQTLAGQVVQVSLMLKKAPAPPATAPSGVTAPPKVPPPQSPTVAGPRVSPPLAPVAPTKAPLVPLLN